MKVNSVMDRHIIGADPSLTPSAQQVAWILSPGLRCSCSTLLVQMG